MNAIDPFGLKTVLLISLQTGVSDIILQMSFLGYPMAIRKTMQQHIMNDWTILLGDFRIKLRKFSNEVQHEKAHRKDCNTRCNMCI